MMHVTIRKSENGEGLRGEKRYPLMKVCYQILAHQESDGRGEYSYGNETERLHARVVDGHYVIRVENVLAEFRLERVRVADIIDLKKARRIMHQEAVRTARETAERLGERVVDLTLKSRKTREIS